MELRLTLLELAAKHGLAATQRSQLLALAGLGAEPASLLRSLPRVLAVGSAALVGLGLIFWVASQWSTLPRMGQFGLLLGVMAVFSWAAWARPGPARAPLGLLAMLATGGLLAFIGQTYQTGADAWQLFALWALLSLPLVWSVRHDIVWAPWALVAMTGITLWMQTHTAHRWRFEPQDLGPQLTGWAAALLVVLMLSALARRWTGAGLWSLRLAVTLAAFIIAGTALGGLFASSVRAQYGLGLLVVALGMTLLASRWAFDVYGLSVLALVLNGLLVAGLIRLLFMNGGRGGAFDTMLLVGLAAAGLLAGTVNLILKLTRQSQSEGVA